MRRLAATLILSTSIFACTPAAAATDNVRNPSTQPDRTITGTDWPAVIARQQAERTWWAEVVAQQRRRAEIHRTFAFAAAVERARLEAQRRHYPSGQCGGSLPPCYVMMRESRGNIRAQNPRSTASGKWQALDSTWRRWGGYAKARHAPEKVQDDFARHLWNNGRGCSHWSAC